jgi:hypothetical protein
MKATAMSRTRPANTVAAAKAATPASAVAEIEITLPEGEFAEFGLWMDEQLAALELRYEGYVTVDSQKRNLRRGR